MARLTTTLVQDRNALDLLAGTHVRDALLGDEQDGAEATSTYLWPGASNEGRAASDSLVQGPQGQVCWRQPTGSSMKHDRLLLPVSAIPTRARERRGLIDSVEKPATEIEASTSLGTVWRARPGYAGAGVAGIGMSFANLRRF